MADTSTTHLALIKQDPNAIPDIVKTNTNLDTLDSEVYARAKTFNGESVGADGGFHVNKIPLADNLESYAGQSTDGTFIVRTTGGSASVENGEASITLIRGRRTHYGYSPQSISAPVVTNMPRTTEPEISAEVTDADEFIGAVTSDSGTVTFNYSTAWSPDVDDYGITVTGTPVAGDSISVTYAKEVPGTIVQSTPHKFVSTGWNLYNPNATCIPIAKYSDEYGYKISGTYVSLAFSTDPEATAGSRQSVTPSNGFFDVPEDGYLFVSGGGSDTAIWATWNDWKQGYRWDDASGTQGEYQAYTESVVDLTSIMGYGDVNGKFPYGLMQVGNVYDEINLSTKSATSNIQRIANTAENMTQAESTGRDYEYDEDYIYIVRDAPIPYTGLNISNGYTVNDHGTEFFTDTDQAVFATTMYGANLKNKLERDVVTISQQALTESQKAQVRTNIGAHESGKTGTYYTGDTTNVSVATSTFVTIRTLTLTPGTWVINGGLEWMNAFTQGAMILLSTGSSSLDMLPGSLVRGTGANGGGYNTTSIRKVTANTTIRLLAYQASGSTQKVQHTDLCAVRIA